MITVNHWVNDLWKLMDQSFFQRKDDTDLPNGVKPSDSCLWYTCSTNNKQMRSLSVYWCQGLKELLLLLPSGKTWIATGWSMPTSDNTCVYRHRVTSDESIQLKSIWWITYTIMDIVDDSNLRSTVNITWSGTAMSMNTGLLIFTVSEMADTLVCPCSQSKCLLVRTANQNACS